MFGTVHRLATTAWRRTMRATLARMERDSHGSRATYVGNDRVLVKCVVEGATIAYYVEASDRLLAPWFIITGKYESELTRYMVGQFRPDSHCIDVGANFGYFTCLMARFCPQGRVTGIEADAHVFAILRDNIAINGFLHARPVHAAAADRAGEATLFRRLSRSGNTSLVAADPAFTELLGEPPAQPFTVRAVRIDDLIDDYRGRLDVMKVDVEGAEPLVVAGAAATIAANPQLTIVMEWSPGQVQAAGFDIGDFLRDLAAHGLRPFDIAGKRLRPLSYGELANLPYRPGIVLKR